MSITITFELPSIDLYNLMRDEDFLVYVYNALIESRNHLDALKQPIDPVEDLLTDSVHLRSSSELVRDPAEPLDRQRISSDALPKGMSEEDFMKFAFFIFEYFKSSLGNTFMGGRHDYQPPETVFFKGSSVTCLKYNNDRVAGELKMFDAASDYDVGFASTSAIEAMDDLTSRFKADNHGLESTLANQIASFTTKIDPGETRYLDIHNQDKNDQFSDDVEKRRFFPDGTPHIKFCEALNNFVGNGHPFNFVIVESLNKLQYPTGLVINPGKVISPKGKDTLSRFTNRVKSLSRSDEMECQLYRSTEADYKHPKPVLTYTWRLIELYHNLYRDKCPDAVNTIQPTIKTLREECRSQRDYARGLLTKAKASSSAATYAPTLFNNTASSSVSNSTGHKQAKNNLRP